MNRIPLPTYVDNEILNSLSVSLKNPRKTNLLADMAAILNSYQSYSDANGNAYLITAANIQHDDLMYELYKSTQKAKPPPSLKHIKVMRDEPADKVCPMCGSFSGGTLDHILPQVAYPEFTIFSKNLVPACKCNSKRQNHYIGPNGSRILHPYYDDILGKRLLIMKLDTPCEIPIIDIEINLSQNDPMRNSVEFHLNKVVKTSPIHNHLNRTWAKLLRQPELLLPTLDITNITYRKLSIAINKELLRLDQLYESKNNWNSIFIAGLKKKEIKFWLTQNL